MIDSFKQFIRKKELCTEGDKILVAVSGGIDSIVLLDLFFKAGFSVSIAHCNFLLRGEESDQDEKFVKTLAEKYHLPIFIKSFDTKKISKELKLSIQETARKLRYDWFEELAGKEKFARIAIAHQGDDQAETFFINLFRGSGVSGLKGMPVRRGEIIRPLLFARRKEIAKYAADQQLQFREDSSNFKDKYLRNRIRHKIIPEIDRLKENFRETLANSLEYLAEDDLLLKQYIEEKKKSVVQAGEKSVKILLSSILNLEPVRIWIYYLLKDYNFKRESTDQILISLIENQVGKIFSSPSHELLIDRKQLIIIKKSKNAGSISNLKEDFNIPLKLIPSVFDVKSGMKFSGNPAFAFFDFDKLRFPLLIRRWRKGDRFIPFGMKGSKLISDFLVDIKLNRFDKKNIFVMLSDNEIIWIIGHRISENYKVDNQTKKIYQVQLLESNDGKT